MRSLRTINKKSSQEKCKKDGLSKCTMLIETKNKTFSTITLKGALTQI